MEEQQIGFDQRKIIERIALSLIMLVVGIWFAFGDTTILNQIPKLDDPALKRFLGWFTITLVTIMVIFLVKCYLKKENGFTIDNSGFEDHSQIISKGKLSWNEIQSIEKSRIGISLITMKVIKVNLKDSSQNSRYLSSGLLKISEDEFYNKLKSFI